MFIFVHIALVSFLLYSKQQTVEVEFRLSAHLVLSQRNFSPQNS
jgi:hypothetical protein